MIGLRFSGWFQCRLATDPDPTDEPRGASGFTFALSGEPDLDRVIRLRDPVAPRSHGPNVGVRVTAVEIDAEPRERHPLLGARMDLLGDPVFESRNYVLGRGSSGPIVPFILQLEGEGVTLRREDLLYPEEPGRPVHRVPTPWLRRRGSIDVKMTVDRLRIADATGISDPLVHRARRRAQLEAELGDTRDPIAVAALQKRIRELSITDPDELPVAALVLYNHYAFEIDGPAKVCDPDARLDGAPDLAPDLARSWPIEFWLGAWDADALCGFMHGMLAIPTRARV